MARPLICKIPLQHHSQLNLDYKAKKAEVPPHPKMLAPKMKGAPDEKSTQHHIAGAGICDDVRFILCSPAELLGP